MRILIIEDQEKLAKSLKKSLEQQGYAADYLLDGESGQRRIEIKEFDYDAVILDIMLPLRDGNQVCKNWRAAGIAIPVLMLTAKDAQADKVYGLDCGADDYLVKPFGNDELVARLRALLRRPRVLLAHILRVGDLALNPVTQQATINNHPIPFTAKEFMLLEYFLRNPNIVLRKEQILQHAWNYNSEMVSNIVDAHIKNIRKKLKEVDYDDIIETVRGMGYRLKT